MRAARATIIFPYSTNQIIVLWRRRCCCRCPCLSSLPNQTKQSLMLLLASNGRILKSYNSRANVSFLFFIRGDLKLLSYSFYTLTKGQNLFVANNTADNVFTRKQARYGHLTFHY